MSDKLPEIPDIPDGWMVASVRSVVSTLQYGISTKAEPDAKGGVAILRMSNIQNGRLDLSDLKYVPRSKELAPVRLKRGDVLFNRTNSPELVGKSAIVDVDDELVFASYLIRLTTRIGTIEPKYLCWWINSAWGREWASRVKTDGVSQSNINGTKLGEMPIPLAPLPEQHRIVVQVEALLEQVNRAKERLDRVPLILKRFRQAVLAAACSGQLCDAREAEVEGPLDFLPALPHGWRWMTAQEACCRVVDCHNKTAPYTESGIRLLRTTNIRGGKLVLDDTRYVSEETYKFWSRRCPPAPGDVLFTREAPMGEAALIPDGMKVCMGQRMMLLRANGEVLLPEYLLLAVQAPYVRKYAEHVAVGSGVLHMRVGDVERLPIPVPPIAEQAALVTTARAAFSFLDKIEERVYQVARIAEQLPQAILSKAFSGELAPTEAELARLEGRTYETAEELLKRVTALGSELPPTHGKGRSKRTRKAG